jgi:hypothetical protein
MDYDRWPLTSQAIADAERPALSENDLTDDDELELGYSLLHLLAGEFGRSVVQPAPGMVYARKLRS